MVAVRVGNSGGDGDSENPNMTDLLWRLNHTKEEEAVVEFSDAKRMSQHQWSGRW
jgi:hypothetical protein